MILLRARSVYRLAAATSPSSSAIFVTRQERHTPSQPAAATAVLTWGIFFSFLHPAVSGTATTLLSTIITHYFPTKLPAVRSEDAALPLLDYFISNLPGTSSHRPPLPPLRRPLCGARASLTPLLAPSLTPVTPMRSELRTLCDGEQTEAL